MSASHNHGAASSGNERNLWIALGLTTTYLIAEIIGGLITGSLALLSDAAHMFTDAAALAISLAAIRIGRRPADKTRTFGYYRFEILAAAFNAVVLFLVAIYILYEAYQRLRNPAPIASGGMLVVASIGLVVNIIAIRLLKSGSADSLNVKSAYLEVWSDLLGSVAVIAAALIIQFTGWQPIDPILAVLIGLWILPRTWTLLKQSLNILLEGVPEGIGLAEIDAALLSVTGVSSVHDLHIWAITSGKVSLTAHLVVDSTLRKEQEVLADVSALLKKNFDIRHSTIQIELERCGPDNQSCLLGVADHASQKH